MKTLTLEYQKEVLKILLQEAKYRELILQVDDTAFDLETLKAVFKLLQKYYITHEVVPTKIDFIQYLVDFNDKATLGAEQYKLLENTIIGLYNPVEANIDILGEIILEYSQYKTMRGIFKQYAGSLDEGIEVWKAMNSAIHEVLDMGVDTSVFNSAPVFLLKDWFTHVSYSPDNIHPTYLKGLNNLTNDGGFFAPQLIIMAGEPKGFKTGTVANIVLEMVKEGLKVFWGDWENGTDSILNRSKQKILHTTKGELGDYAAGGKDEEFSKGMVKAVSMLGGELVVQQYQSLKDGVHKVERDLAKLKEATGFVPDVVVWDELDKLGTKDMKKAKHERIQDIYLEVVAFNMRHKVPSFSMSQLTRASLSKLRPTKEDLGSDIGKVHNSHAIFCLCRTGEEKEQGIGRLIPIAQREGQQVGTVFLRLEEPTQTVTEIVGEELANLLEITDFDDTEVNDF